MRDDYLTREYVTVQKEVTVHIRRDTLLTKITVRVYSRLSCFVGLERIKALEKVRFLREQTYLVCKHARARI